ncbi:hypothetical protein BBO99_00004902 [Phytophthora kernoviae]|uniref:Uncharacterized protein n=1 Tax=Phytophthora kernoviae TaxID=325452 RepID=A0A3R7GWX4_9STRA|nr:hypothetical protein JM18_004234 [Phytophthora kernoviae]RLN02818.1 hypothetical protein BBI17_005004 [Phytophthora kernoviae]RLN79924.1 hypothetical protein BBO99_00004902 [Phytophthora kernoviae]
MASAQALTDAYIMLTPTASSESRRLAQSAPAGDVLARKWAAAAKRKASLEVLKDRKLAELLRFIEMNVLKGGFIGSLKRMYASPGQIKDEIKDVLDAISDIDAVLMHPTYLDLIGATKGSTLCREIEKMLNSHSKIQQSGPICPCMCEVYYKSVQRFGEFYREQAQTANQVRQSTVASDSLMRSRGVLSFYTDTIYLLDKREFRPTHGLKKCTVYGFGRRKLFEIVRVSRKKWSLRHANYGEIYTLSLEKYAAGVNMHHMVAVKRLVPDSQNGGLRQENVCFVKKSKRFGYRCLLMSEVISQGKVTTSISIQKPKSPPGDHHFHYVTMSDISGPGLRSSVCSSTLSVPYERYKHMQRLNVSGGCDVVTFLALAASYDIIVGALSFWMERKY